ncbi:hypothetical protein Q8A67_009889 [Cirrhinus molitorella]|uniref:Reelin domain-containing protein n=1 Tax=Cirrhinus molitorella TaxID=172907 RepID=A0AA88TPY3_9TELE|nr:hypothetical protein Q8A67_009889 [Cirrhinus molitorella]
MYNACAFLFLSFFGFSMLKFITCYSDGSLLGSECKGLDISHGASSNNDSPFKVHPEERNVINKNESITVSLLADHEAQFRGFMLDVRRCEKCESAGMFSLIDPDNSVLICGGRVVTQPNNIRKKEVYVLWTPEETGLFFFRAVFVESYNTYWRRNLIPTSPPAPTTKATSHITQANSRDTSQTAPTIFQTTSTPKPAPPPECVKYTSCALALLLFSRLCFLGGSSLLMIIRPVSKKATMIASVTEPAFKIIAAVFILIKQIKYVCVCDSLQIAFTAFTVAAVVSSLLHTITVFLYCGPSHELRKCWICGIIMVDLINTVITATAIFLGVWCFQEHWLLYLMGGFFIWEFMFYLSSVCFKQMEKYQSRKKLKKKGNQNNILEKRTSPWLFMFIIFSVFNVMFTAALMTGVSLVDRENC